MRLQRVPKPPFGAADADREPGARGYCNHVTNPIVHFEILGSDGAALIEFYRGLFGWPIEKQALPGWPDYGIIEAPSQGIGGAVGSADAAGGPAVLIYVEVDDLAAHIERAVGLGATVAMPVTHLPGTRVTVAWLKDPQGNLLGLLKSREG